MPVLKLTNNRASDGDERATARTGDNVYLCVATFARVLRVVQAVKTLEVRYLPRASRFTENERRKRNIV